MMRLVAVFVVVFLVVGCGDFRHSSMVWPAKLVSLSQFSESQETLILSLIDEFNERSGKNLIVLDSSETESVIVIQHKESIPRLATTIAGRATREDGKCTVELAAMVAANEDLLKPVLWHELGHCAGLEHDSNEETLMYKEAKYYPKYSEEAIDLFFSKIIQATGF